MIRNLNKNNKTCYYYKDGIRIEGIHDRIIGNESGITGDVSGIIGNIDECFITDEERQLGIDISELIKDGK